MSWVCIVPLEYKWPVCFYLQTFPHPSSSTISQMKLLEVRSCSSHNWVWLKNAAACQWGLPRNIIGILDPLNQTKHQLANCITTIRVAQKLGIMSLGAEYYDMESCFSKVVFSWIADKANLMPEFTIQDCNTTKVHIVWIKPYQTI